MDKKIYNMLNLAMDIELKRTGGCVIDDLSLTWDNEITIVTEGGKVYKLTIIESNEVFEE